MDVALQVVQPFLKVKFEGRLRCQSRGAPRGIRIDCLGAHVIQVAIQSLNVSRVSRSLRVQLLQQVAHLFEEASGVSLEI